MGPVKAGQAGVLALVGALLAVPFVGVPAAGADTQEQGRERFTAILVARHSGKCLDGLALTGELQLGSDVQQWTCSLDHKGQLWNLTATSDGYYTFRATDSGLCMEVVPGDVHSGAGIQLWTCVAGHRNQEWKLVQRDNGYFAIVVRHTGMCLDVQHALLEDGANVRQVTCVRGRKNQEWRLA